MLICTVTATAEPTNKKKDKHSTRTISTKKISTKLYVICYHFINADVIVQWTKWIYIIVSHETTAVLLRSNNNNQTTTCFLSFSFISVEWESEFKIENQREEKNGSNDCV